MWQVKQTGITSYSWSLSEENKYPSGSTSRLVMSPWLSCEVIGYSGVVSLYFKKSLLGKPPKLSWSSIWKIKLFQQPACVCVAMWQTVQAGETSGVQLRPTHTTGGENNSVAPLTLYRLQVLPCHFSQTQTIYILMKGCFTNFSI